jgi:hypothetical protein
VQQFGLELLILADGWKATEQDEKAFEDQLKFALVAAGVDATELWQKDAADVPDDEDVDYDYSAVDWQQGSTDDWEHMQQALSQSRVQVSGDRPEPEDEPPVPDMDDGFDREWQ